MSAIDNALLARYGLEAQPKAVLIASVADGATEIARLKLRNAGLKALLSAAEATIRVMDRPEYMVRCAGITATLEVTK